MKHKFIRLEALTPVHIGTGEDLDPMSYLMREEEDTAALYTLDLLSWVDDQADPQSLAASLANRDVPAVRSFVADQCDPDMYSMRRVQVTSNKIWQDYRNKLKDLSSRNQLLISPHLTSGQSQAPILPGSSLKGAIRTALIDELDRTERLGLKQAAGKDPRGREMNRVLESVLGKITDSAFKQLKVGDFTAPLNSSLLVEALEMGRKPDKQGTPKSPCEVLGNQAMNPQGNWALYGKISIGALGKDDDRLSLKDRRTSWNWDDLASLVNAYMQKRFQAEHDKFFCQPHFSSTKPVIEALNTAMANLKPGEMVLKVGHYAHVEYVTVTDNEPLTRMVKGRKMPFGTTTRTLANGKYPFGWVKLVPVEEAEYRKGEQARQEKDRQVIEARRQRREGVVAERLAAEQVLLERQRKAQAEAEEVARQQAELDAMSDEQRMVHLLETGQTQEHEAVEVFNKLDSLEGDQQVEVARALKGYWEKLGKWSVKPKKKKQYDKVCRVKAILGE